MTTSPRFSQPYSPVADNENEALLDEQHSAEKQQQADGVMPKPQLDVSNSSSGRILESEDKAKDKGDVDDTDSASDYVIGAVFLSALSVLLCFLVVSVSRWI